MSHGLSKTRLYSIFSGIPVQSVRNKFSRDVFSVSDLLKIFDFVGCTMYVEFEDGQKIRYTIDDVKDSSKPKTT